LRYNLNWWVASPRKTKKIKRGQSRSRTTHEEIPKVVSTPLKKEKCGKKEEAPKSTTTPPKSNKMVWRPKKVQSSMPTPTGTDVPTLSKN
jgi:hypothetical protein